MHSKEMSKPGGRPERYSMTSLMLVALFLCYIDRTIISIAAIEMQKELAWSDSQKGLVLSVFYGGYLLMQLLGGYLANRFGGKKLYLFAVLGWSLFTVLTPSAAYASLAVLIVVRFLLGAGEGPAYPAGYNLIHGWMPAEERSRAVALMSTSAAIGTVFALLISGKLIELYGWPSLFYVFGSLGFVWSIVWYIKVPNQAPLYAVNSEETHNDADTTSSKDKRSIPWKALLLHPAVITLYVVNLGGQSLSFIMASWLPSYLVDTHKVTTTEAGLYSVLPWITLAICTYLAGLYADRCIARGEDSLSIRKRMLRVGFGLIIICLALITQSPGLYEAVALVVVIFTGMAIIIPGFSTVPGELFPRHGDILFGVLTASGSLGAMFYVTLTGYLVEATGTYNAVFWSLSVTCFISMMAFQLFGRTDEIILEEKSEAT